MSIPTSRTIHVIVNTEGDVGEAVWANTMDDLPSYGGNSTYYRVMVPQDSSHTEITEALDCFLGDYDPPEDWDVVEQAQITGSMSTLQMFAMLTVEGTAASETALCADHATPSRRQDYLNENRGTGFAADGFADDADFVDCSGNEALTCQVCGRNTLCKSCSGLARRGALLRRHALGVVHRRLDEGLPEPVSVRLVGPYVICEVNGGVAELDTSEDVAQLFVDWDNIGSDWASAEQVLQCLDAAPGAFPAADVERIRNTIAEIWPVETHDPECTGCEHDCPWRKHHLGTPYCPICDDHSEAVHAGFGPTPCDCGDKHDS